MLAELEEKKAKLKKRALDFKDNRSRLNAEASKWATTRNELNKATKELIDKAQKLKILRDEDNKNVAKAKQDRNEYNEKTNELYAKIDEIRKKYNLIGERSIRGLRKEIDYLEFKQQTEVLSPDKEKQLVEKISALQSDFKSKKAQMEKNDMLRDILDEAQQLRDKASEYHELVTKYAERAQEYHDQMIVTFKRADKVRAEADSAHREFVKAQEAADKEHRDFIRTQREIRDFDKIISGLRRKNKERRKDKVKTEARREGEDILSHFRKGEKLDTNDLMRLQRSGLV
ncbi:MAG: coiled-coil protein [Methanotrichaceae archaeon]